MTGAPWSVKGIDPKTREIAKDLARRSGMTLGEWLTHVIAEDGGEGLVAAASRKAGDRPASENRPPRRGGDDLERVLEALQDLSARFEASVEEQAETAARFDRAIAELKADQTEVASRLQAAEQGGAGGGKVETLRALEGALNKVAGHLAAGEGRQREAMVELRRELGEEMSRVADQVNRKVLEVENRGADAIAQVGAEVTRVANAVEQRLRRADDVQAQALEKLGGEIARITERLSERIAAAERRSAQSVEDVGQQVARMADRMHGRQERNESELAERIRQSEERTAKLLEEARQTIDRRLLRAGAPTAEDAPLSSAFSERWTPVETPVVEAAEAEAAEVAEPENLFAAPDMADELLLEPEGPHAEVLEADAPESDILAVDAELIEEEGLDAESILEASYDGLTTDADDDEPYADLDEDDHPGKPGSIGYQAYAPTLTADPGFHAEDDLEAMQAVADAIAADDAEGREDEDEPAEAEESLRPSTRDLIAQAKAAAFAEPTAFAEGYGPAIHGGAARQDDEEEPEAPTFIDLGARKSRNAHAVRGAILAGGAAAFMGLAGAGYIALMHPEIAPGLGGAAAKPIPVGPPSAPTPAPAAAQQAAVALATTPPSAAPAAAKPDGQDLEALYRDAVAKVDAGDASGVAPLRTAANLGYAPAQRRLGKLYEDGGAGVDKDPAEGRRWTIRAAANGDARGMHNLGLDYYQGVGGPKNYTVAAQYFQRAAELGLRDSQYNIGRFYEAGIGVQRDLGAAYRWYLIAGRVGDTEAAARAEALKAQLSPDQRARAEAMAAAFRADPSAPPASLTASLRGANPKQLALAQRALGKLGYYKGAADGQASEALGEAIQSYQRERGLADNGQLSPELVQTFAHIAQ